MAVERCESTSHLGLSGLLFVSKAQEAGGRRAMEKSKPDQPKWEVDEIGADLLPIFVGIRQCAGMTDFLSCTKRIDSGNNIKYDL